MSQKLDSRQKSSNDSSKSAPRPTFARIVVENAECLAIAIVMALVLKFFLIEAYKIPTGSMQPTIIGDSQTGIFDRVLVNKLSYLVDDPERWDVIVFKYPLDLQKNYIKRLIGLPGERVRIVAGDIYISDRDDQGEYGEESIARKPDAVRESVLKEVFPGYSEKTLGSFFAVSPKNHPIQDGRLLIQDENGAKITTSKVIRDDYYHGYEKEWISPQSPWRERSGTGRHVVGDLGIAFDAKLEGPGLIRVAIREGNDLEHRAVLPVGKNLPATVETDAGRVVNGNHAEGDVVASSAAASSESMLEASETYRVRFLNVDDTLVLEVDGDEVARVEYQGSPAQISSNAIEVEVQEAKGEIGGVEVWRDIYYLPSSRPSGAVSFDVPDEHYFAMGDNTQNSSDSREWRTIAYELDGDIVVGNDFPEQRPGIPEDANPRTLPDRTRVFRDLYGEDHPLPTHPKQKGRERQSFVRREYLLGKAMAVFWPIYPTLRWKLIR